MPRRPSPRTAIAGTTAVVAIATITAVAAWQSRGTSRAPEYRDAVSVDYGEYSAAPAAADQSEPVTCVYEGTGRGRRWGCASEWSSGNWTCYSMLHGNDRFLVLHEGNNPTAVAARSRPGRWNIRDANGRELLAYIVRSSGADWTIYSPKHRPIGRINGRNAAEAGLAYVSFGDPECAP